MWKRRSSINPTMHTLTDLGSHHIGGNPSIAYSRSAPHVVFLLLNGEHGAKLLLTTAAAGLRHSEVTAMPSSPPNDAIGGGACHACT